ncbi:hypothetical protein EJ377_00855 [Chryseobacterium arthrosphaerae]|uniref:Uncharacterized protein n=1 Tax=Chryseobacterium arthrosphaerae TaxID=651561 RepID=A0A432DYD4_9FLAO|nr:hypothetical protein EJ377_00855 [Chryseobacterium arthrosphaerae]
MKKLFFDLKEYAEYSKFNYMNRFKTYYSKVFRCDDKKDTYIFMIEGTTTGLTYLIKRTAVDGKLILSATGCLNSVLMFIVL